MMLKKFKWLNVFTVLMVISVTLTLYFSYNILKHDYTGASVQIVDNEVIITSVEPLTWSDRNLEVGDKVISVDGIDPLENEIINNWNALEQVKNIVIEKPDGNIESMIVDVDFDSQMVFQLLIPLIIVIISFYCSYLIYKSYRKSENSKRSALLLISFLFTFSLAYMCGGSSARGDEFSRILVVLLLLATPITYLQFIYSYYKELSSTWFSKKWIWICYSLIPINYAVIDFKELIGINGTILKLINLSSALVAFLLCGILITMGLRRVTYKTQKYMIKVLMLSNVFAFMPFILLYVVPFVFFKVEIFSPVFLTGFLLIIPFSLVYQFLVAKIYDIEFIVGRIRYYSLIITLPAIAGVILFIAIKSGNPTVFTIRTFIILFIILFVTLHLKEVLDYRFKLNRFSEKINYQDRLTMYTKEIRIAKNVYEVTDNLKNTIIDTLLVNEAYLIQMNDDCSIDNENKKWIVNRYSDVIKVIKHDLGGIKEINNGFLINIGEAEGKTFIILALCDINTPRLTRDERQWLNNLAYYTNVTLENFVKIEHLMENLNELESKPQWLNRIVYSVEERQRSELSKDLHDSVLQDLINSKRHIERLYASYKDMDEDLLDIEVQQLFSDMSNSINTTREICNNLRPHLLYDLGLDSALKKLVSQHQQNVDYNVTITTSKLDQSINEDTKLSLYRITQELLNNAKKHSCASNVKLIVVKIKEKIVLHYEDDGMGEDLDYISNKEGSMGLSGIKERVRTLNGTIDIETDVGQGFKVVIEI
ncbi:Sensor histidine kinase ComP [compost metagenome]